MCVRAEHPQRAAKALLIAANSSRWSAAVGISFSATHRSSVEPFRLFLSTSGDAPALEDLRAQASNFAGDIAITSGYWPRRVRIAVDTCCLLPETRSEISRSASIHISADHFASMR